MKEISFSKKIKEKLKKAGVGVVYLFGSMVEGTSNKNSDYDLGIVLISKTDSLVSLQIHNLLAI